MAKILIAFGSLTGNTEYVAHELAKVLSTEFAQIDVLNIADLEPDTLKNYDYLILGSSTWHGGELQDDFEMFVQKPGFQNLDLSQQKSAVFGCGDSGFPRFCEANQILTKLLTERQSEIIIKDLCIDGYPMDEQNQAHLEKWALDLVSEIKKRETIS